ncbi:hypothetical protein AB0E63_16020 [Kribbella sp. NPDC026596]
MRELAREKGTYDDMRGVLAALLVALTVVASGGTPELTTTFPGR